MLHSRPPETLIKSRSADDYTIARTPAHRWPRWHHQGQLVEPKGVARGSEGS